ncbi:MAG: trypsin-like peptidase domain-containing protein [bacterium]|nr:trypsin-like peptidase domain-containing protein [bacterium]MDE0502235.1 trypsin-like peptidase domain-containing protein [bacterium]
MASITSQLVRAAIQIRKSSGRVWGTGFGYARPDSYDSSNPRIHRADDSELWRLWFVTCAHVVDAIEDSRTFHHEHTFVEVNEVATGGSRVGYPVTSLWTRHEGWTERCTRLGPIANREYTPDDAAVDVAVTTAPMHLEGFRQLDWWGFAPRLHLTKAMMSSPDPRDRPISEGDAVFMVGFPVGYYDDAKNWPVVRQGVIAQLQPYLEGSARTFLIDGSVFGGSSGGPVITVPQALAITGTHQFTRNALIGMVSGCRLHPGLGENADLGIVVPLDTINETIETALRAL